MGGGVLQVPLLFKTVMYQQDRLDYSTVTNNLHISVAEDSVFLSHAVCPAW